MNHNFHLDGYAYRLRPIKISDAQFIVDTRLEDAERNKYIHPISPDVKVQEQWLEEYFNREGDYYFVVENRITGQSEGLISIYDVYNGKAEWGRWILRKDSLAAVESVYLMYRIAFEQIGLDELYCRTVADNTSVVSFHTSIGELTRTIHNNIFELNGKKYDAVEQYSDKKHFYADIAPFLKKRIKTIFKRTLAHEFGGFKFHHIGVATRSIDKELPLYLLMGYNEEGDAFVDPEQGVRGLFLVSDGQPRLELLENLPDSVTLNEQLENNVKLYHTAYYVGNIEKAIKALLANRAKIISPLKQSEYFKGRICFMMMPNMSMIELIEEKIKTQ